MIRIHLLLWLGSFFLWYLLYVSSFCALIFPYGALSLFLHWFLWKLIWSLTICSLLSAALTAPAKIPTIFVPPDDFLDKHSRSLLQAIAGWARSRKLSVRFRKMATDLGTTKAPNYCYICRLIKPDRAHHCRKCGRCVLRMDHHCPVLGECIHMHNHKFFMLFLFWASILCIFATIAVMPIVIFRFISIYSSKNDSTQMIPIILVTSGAINAMVCGIALLCFLRELTLALLRNETTLEGIALHEYGEWDAFDDGIAHYDLGTRSANFRSIFGPYPHLWLFPIPSTYGNGYEFEYFLNVASANDKKYKALACRK